MVDTNSLKDGQSKLAPAPEDGNKGDAVRFWVYVSRIVVLKSQLGLKLDIISENSGHQNLIKFGAFQVKGSRLSSKSLVNNILSFYLAQLIVSIPKSFLSLDVLLNPVSLIKNIRGFLQSDANVNRHLQLTSWGQEHHQRFKKTEARFFVSSLGFGFHL